MRVALSVKKRPKVRWEPLIFSSVQPEPSSVTSLRNQP